MAESEEKQWSGINEFQLYLFNEGTNFQAYQVFGPHKIDNGWRFAVWAPNAEKVALCGDFNDWNQENMQLAKIGTTGVWYGVFDVPEGSIYKYAITGKSGKVTLKSDPYAFSCELRPNTASVVRDVPKIRWTDSAWMKKREKTGF